MLASLGLRKGYPKIGLLLSDVAQKSDEAPAGVTRFGIGLRCALRWRTLLMNMPPASEAGHPATGASAEPGDQ